MSDPHVHASEATTGEPADSASTGLGRRVGVGAVWSVLNAGTLRLATFAVSLVIAHVVAPAEFGVFTVALTAFNIAMSVSELGVVSAIVREPLRTRAIAPTIFTISLLTSGLLTLAMVAFARPIAGILGDPQADDALKVLSIFVLLAGVSQVPAALLSRDFMQRQRFIVDASFFVSSTVVLLVLVFAGEDVMALAWSRVAGQIVTVIMITWMAPEKYWPGLAWHEVRRLLSFGLPLAAANLITLAIANVDFIVVGRTLGVTELGYYNLAFNISGWPVTIFSAVLISVTLPTLSRVRESPKALTSHLSAGLSAISAASFPVCALFVALAPQLIDIVYGHRWHPAWEALVVLAIFGAARTVLTLFSDLVIALGYTRRLLVIQLIWISLLSPAMVLCVRTWGIAGAGIAHAVVVVIGVIPLYMLVVRRHARIQLRKLVTPVAVPLGAAVAGGLAAKGATELVSPEVLKLLLGTLVGLVAYSLLGFNWLRSLARRLRLMYWSHDTAELKEHESM